MKTTLLTLAAALALGYAQARAADPDAMPATKPVPAAQPVAAPADAPACATPCPAKTCATKACKAKACKAAWGAKCWDWLTTYRPLHRPGWCGCCKQAEPCCNPPLYTFFLCSNGDIAREPHPTCWNTKAKCGQKGCTKCDGSACGK